jgi:hypothetical protein
MLKINFKFYFVNFHFDPVAYIPWSIYASCIRLRPDKQTDYRYKKKNQTQTERENGIKIPELVCPA